MGLFDKLKQQGMDFLQQGTDALNNLTGNQQPTVLRGQDQSDVYTSRQQTAPPMPPTPPTSSTPPPPPTAPVVSAATPVQDGGLYGNYIERLIDMALADGELTEKEKQVLFKKAESMGIDLDEFEMVLDARLFEKRKAMQAPKPVAHDSAPKSDKYGDVRKCPSCGAIVESFIIRCPDCGHEFRNIGATSSFSLLSAKIEALDAKKTGGFFSAFTDEGIDKKKASLIKGFPIPTTKEDILEFLTMATPLGMPATKSIWSSGRLDPNEREISKAWRAKCEQVIMKARFSMKEDKALLEQIEQYAIQLKIK